MLINRKYLTILTSAVLINSEILMLYNGFNLGSSNVFSNSEKAK